MISELIWYDILDIIKLLQDIQVGMESLEMLNVRAVLEERLKQKGVLSSPKYIRRTEHMEPVNGYLLLSLQRIYFSILGHAIFKNSLK